MIFSLACISTHKWFAAIVFIIFAVASSLAFADQSKKTNVVIIYPNNRGTLDAGCYGSKDQPPFTPMGSAQPGFTLRHLSLDSALMEHLSLEPQRRQSMQ